MTWEFIDGHRTWVGTPGDAPSSEVSTASTPSLISTSEDGSLPPCEVHPGYVMRPDTIALHFPADTYRTLMALFPQQAGHIQAVALDVELEAERQQQDARDKVITGGLR